MDMPKHSSGRTLVSAPLFARTDGYFAPEMIGRKVSPKSDVYSFGVVSLLATSKDCGLVYYGIIIGNSGDFHWHEGL